MTNNAATAVAITVVTYESGLKLVADVRGHYRDAVGRVARNCAAYNTLTHLPAIQIDVRGWEA